MWFILNSEFISQTSLQRSRSFSNSLINVLSPMTPLISPHTLFPPDFSINGTNGSPTLPTHQMTSPSSSPLHRILYFLIMYLPSFHSVHSHVCTHHNHFKECNGFLVNLLDITSIYSTHPTNSLQINHAKYKSTHITFM